MKIEEVFIINSDYIFILGIGRTGSKIYMNFLREDDDIAIMPEMGFIYPYGNDIVGLYKKHNLLRNEVNIEGFIDDLLSYNVKTSAWDLQMKDHLKIDGQKLFSDIKDSKREPKDILSAIINNYTEGLGKKRGGAKFPIPIMDIDKLFQWYPNSKIIHITRKPHASIVSHARQFKKDNKNSIIRFIKYKLLIIHGIIMFNRSYKIHIKYRNNPRYTYSKFEDIVTSPDEKIKELCDFLGVKFREEMLNPPAVDSSFNRKIVKGFDSSAMDRWRKKITPFENFLISLFVGSKYERFDRS